MMMIPSLCARLEREGFRPPYPEVTCAQVRNATLKGCRLALNKLLFKLTERVSYWSTKRGISLVPNRKWSLVAEYVNDRVRRIGMSSGITENLINIVEFEFYIEQQLLKEGIIPHRSPFSPSSSHKIHTPSETRNRQFLYDEREDRRVVPERVVTDTNDFVPSREYPGRSLSPVCKAHRPYSMDNAMCKSNERVSGPSRGMHPPCAAGFDCCVNSSEPTPTVYGLRPARTFGSEIHAYGYPDEDMPYSVDALMTVDSGGLPKLIKPEMASSWSRLSSKLDSEVSVTLHSETTKRSSVTIQPIVLKPESRHMADLRVLGRETRRIQVRADTEDDLDTKTQKKPDARRLGPRSDGVG